MQIIHRFANATELLVRLSEKAVREMGINSGTARRFKKRLKVFHLFFQQTSVRQQFKRSREGHRALQLE